MENTVKKNKKLSVILNIVFYVLLALVAIYSVLALFSDQNRNLTSFLGISALTVQSDSMSPTFDKGDMIFITTNFDVADLRAKSDTYEGDVITYLMLVTDEYGATVVDDTGNPVYVYNSHRIIDIVENDGSYTFYTQGDNNAVADSYITSASSIVGVWTNHRIAGVGTGIDNFISFLKSSTGFFLFIVLPVFAFLVYQVVRFIGLMTEYRSQKTVGDRVKFEEEAIAIARAQLEAEMRQNLEKEQQEKENK